MRFSITTFAIAMLGPQLGALAAPSSEPASVEHLDQLAVRVANGEPVPENVLIARNDGADAPKLAARQNYCGKATNGKCCCTFCYIGNCSTTCGITVGCR